MVIVLFIALTAVAVVSFFMRQILGGMVGLYRVVPVNEVHIRIMNNKKESFSSRTSKTSYWVVPFITKLHKLPLSNLAIPTDNIKLNDINMAKFMCDIMCFVNINDIDLAVERLTLTHITSELGFDDERLGADLRAIMESIGRTVATKQTILEIYMNRQALVDAITKEVQGVFPKWGIALVNLELKHIKDADGSTIIADIERLRASEIRRDADIKTATTEREAKIAQAEAEESYRKREVLRDQVVEIAKQEAMILTQQKTAEANMQAVEAARRIDVGRADIHKQVVEQEAMAQRIKDTTEAEGSANKIRTVKQAEADMVKAVKVAEAEGTLKLAEAMKAFNDTAINVKVLDIMKEVQLAKFSALGNALSQADIKLIMSGANSQNLFGLDLTAEGGANLQQFLQASGIDEAKVKEVITKYAPLFKVTGAPEVK